ncbi:MAG: class I SAM-dependent methyltransferase [Pseudohongiella sp.]|uniref:class I SAM-dependent methyltransferase n=1 Tax=Pseudohongiella sp. TaxID=1979412 RepID=UPI0034A030B3
MQTKEHWEEVYSSKDSDEVSWFQEHAELSLKIIRVHGVSIDASIIDVGGGASTLVDDLVEEEYSAITVLDLSSAALETAKKRLGAKKLSVSWLEADVLDVELPINGYDVWHDRAVFHFLTSESERHRYVQQVLRALKPGGLVIVATFAEDGPEKCSGLPVMRYSTSALHSEFGEPFQLLGSEPEVHLTPSGNEQKFVYCFCKRQ